MIQAKAVNHIGIAVHSIEQHRKFYEEVLGATFESIEDVPSQQVRVGFFRLADVRLELLEPTDPASSVAAYLEKRGEGLHHVAYTVRNIEERLAELKAGGIRLIDETPRTGTTMHESHFCTPKARVAC